MRFQNITIAMTAVAAVSALACTGTHEASRKSATPELQAAPATRGAKSPAPTPLPAADTDTIPPAALAVGQHPTPPVLDSLIKGTLPARGLYVFRFGANTRRLKHPIGIADSTE